MSDITAAVETVAKPWYQSRTIWGAGIAAASGIAGIAGYHIPVDLQGQMVDLVTGAGTLVGAGLATWGRLKASAIITR